MSQDAAWLKLIHPQRRCRRKLTHGTPSRPGHTPGSVSVLLDQGDLIAGDMLTGGFLGLLQYRPSNPPFHDDPDQALDSLQAALSMKPHTLHIGHGGPMRAANVQRWLDRQLTQRTRRNRRKALA